MGIWRNLSRAGNIASIADLLIEIADQFDIRRDKVVEGWKDCNEDNALPQVPVFNPLTGEKVACIPSPFDGGELSDEPENPPDDFFPDESEDQPDITLPIPPSKDPIYIPPVTNPDPVDNPEREPKPIPYPITEPRPPQTLPKIPRRRLPSLERPTSDDGLLVFQDDIIGVERSSFERTYGCMLSNSISLKPAVFLKCSFPERSEDNDNLDFILYQIEKATGKSIRENHRTLSTNVVLLPNTGLSISPNTEYSPSFGSGFLHELAQSYRVSSRNAFQSADGNVNTFVKFVDCGQDDNQFEGIEQYDYRPFPLNSGNDECFVPIRNFRENEPEQLGMKRQLQIIFEGEPDNNGRPRQKQITIPSPLDEQNLTQDLLNENIPKSWEFGTVKVETDIVPYGHIRFYAREEDIEESVADEFLDDLINLIDGSEKTINDQGDTKRRYSRRSRNIITGEFKRKKALLFEWRDGDGQPPFCQTFTFD